MRNNNNPLTADEIEFKQQIIYAFEGRVLGAHTWLNMAEEAKKNPRSGLLDRRAGERREDMLRQYTSPIFSVKVGTATSKGKDYEPVVREACRELMDAGIPATYKYNQAKGVCTITVDYPPQTPETPGYYNKPTSKTWATATEDDFCKIMYPDLYRERCAARGIPAPEEREKSSPAANTMRNTNQHTVDEVKRCKDEIVSRLLDSLAFVTGDEFEVRMQLPSYSQNNYTEAMNSIQQDLKGFKIKAEANYSDGMAVIKVSYPSRLDQRPQYGITTDWAYKFEEAMCKKLHPFVYEARKRAEKEEAEVGVGGCITT